MDQMDLPQIGRVAEFRDPRQVLDRRAGMRVTLDACPASNVMRSSFGLLSVCVALRLTAFTTPDIR
jgi:hypothetical protein